MTSLSIKEYNQDIDYKVEKIKAMRKIAEEVTLTEFIEQYPRHDYVSLGSLWFSVNDDIPYEEAIKYVGGTDSE